MSKLRLSLGMSANPRSRPVLEGLIQPDGIELVPSVVHPSELFWRQLHFGDFDISEMSLSSLLAATAAGNRDWIGLPVFTIRRFFHTWIWIRPAAGIERPEDLRGKRVGVPEYQQTAALWGRGVLQHEFGVAPAEMLWFMERTEERSHGGATGFRPPAGVRFEHIPPEKSIGSMLLGGELDATLLYSANENLVDRSRARLEDRSDVRLLFPDPALEGRRYYAKTGIFPINHGMVVRRSLAEQHPWVALNVFKAFEQAKASWLADARDMVTTEVQLGLMPPETRQALSHDPYPYGVRSNRLVLDTIASYSHEQGLTPRLLDLAEIFAPSTLDL